MKFLKPFLFAVIIISALFAQTDEKIDEKKKDLSDLRGEISELEKRLQDVNTEELNSLDYLEDLSKKELLLNKMINKLGREEKNKSAAIKKTEQNISDSEARIKDLRGKYADYVVWLYKQGDNKILNLLLGSETINQAVMRYKYLDYLTDKNEIALNEILSYKEKLIHLKSKLIQERKDKIRLSGEKKEDLDGIKNTRINRENLLKKLKKDEKYIEGEIQRKRLAEIEIKNVIDKLIEEKRRKEIEFRTRKLKEENLKTPPELDYNNLASFDNLKGSLKWPVKKGRIIRDFGENTNEKLKTVTLNYGIDISVKDSLNVYPVAEGIVSAIDWIPGYGSVLIITHKDEYRTVYGHLSDIHVNEGDKVFPNMVIGKVNESLEGNILHFEIWNERNYQDPDVWLVKK